MVTKPVVLAAALFALWVSIFSHSTCASERISAADIPVDPSTVKGSITYYSHFYNFSTDGHFLKWANGFKKIYPNVTDVRVIVLTDYRTQIGALMASGHYGDIVDIVDNLSKADYEIFYEPLNSLGMQSKYQFAERFEIDGIYYGFAYGADIEAVVYNKTLFAMAGIDKFPRTKTELFAACQKLRGIGVTPFALNMAMGWPMQQWDKAALMFAGDGDYYAKMLKDAAPFARDKPYGKTLAFIRELISAGCTEQNLTASAHIDASPAWQTALEDMATNKIGMWFMANWSIKQIIDKAIQTHHAMTADDLGFAPLPIDDSGEPKILMDTDFGLAVSAMSANKPTAKAFLYYLLNVTDLANAGGFIPGNVNTRTTLPQIAELQSTQPQVIRMVNPTADFGDAMAAAGFDFMVGTYLRSPILAKDFDEALREMNHRWATATGKH
jgi:ABC-type glycerol-3-phosphate transport system substrate-binding protein